jgi:hypothetical protein
MQQRIQELINRVPKETKDVRNELVKLGINRDKQKRWKSTPNAGIDGKDAIILVKYFRRFDECGVKDAEDLYVPEKSEHEIAEEMGLIKS